MTISKMSTSTNRILRRYTLCDSCLGRQFATYGYGLSNKARGHALKTLLLMVGTETYQTNTRRGLIIIRRLAENGQFQPARDFLEKEEITDIRPSQDCDICRGIMDQLSKPACAIMKGLEGWERKTILIGTKVNPDIIEREEQLRSEFQIVTGEPIKAELNRELGKLVTAKLGLDADFSSPDIVALIHIPEQRVELEIHSLFIYGRYQKLTRGIPQTHWPCRECGGRGCSRCNGTGKMYLESVEELIAPYILKATQGNDVKFHGAGREDIDALMLGNGRPFVIEILNPKKRAIDLKSIVTQINASTDEKVKVSNFRFANKEVVKQLKKSATSSKKVYKAIVYVETPIHEETLQRLQNLSMPLAVEQRTPQRVLHRRADRVRKKRIHSLQARLIDANTFELNISCQGGLYVKEFISGDQGRTVPSISELVGTSASCKQLDVMDVVIAEDRLPW